MEKIAQSILDASYHKGGLKTKLIGKPNLKWKNLKNELLKITNISKSSNVNQKGHRTYWTEPEGEARQWSLWNTSGMFDETDTIDPTPANLDKKSFHHSEDFPNVYKFLNSWPNLVNARINKLGSDSKLNQHEENIIHEWDNNSLVVRVRFHLPIQTHTSCKVFLDGELHHYQEGKIYYFNNGCVHSAINPGPLESRLHLVWDCILSEEVCNKIYKGEDIRPLHQLPVNKKYPRARRLRRPKLAKEILIL